MGIINEISLPDFLFNKDSSKKSQESPTDHFDPVAAISDADRAFVATTSPSQESSLKTVIFNKSSFSKYTSLTERIILITKLKSLGFDVFLCCDEASLTKVEDSKIVPSLLLRLADIDDKRSYELAGKANIARDNVALISAENYRAIVSDLNDESQWGNRFGLAASHLNADSRSASPIEVKNADNLSLVLQNYKDPEKAREFLRKYGKAYINSGSDLVKCIKAAPYLARDLVKGFKDKIANAEQLILCAKAAPEESKMLFELHKNKCDVTDKAALIKIFPKDAIVFYKDHKEEKSAWLSSTKNLWALLKAGPPDFVVRDLISRHRNEAFVGEQLSDCLKYAPEFAEDLLEGWKDRIDYLELKQLFEIDPEFALKEIQSGRLNIWNKDGLEASLKAFPELADELIDIYRRGIKFFGSEDLAVDLKIAFLKNDHQQARDLIITHKDKIGDGNDLAKCLEAAPFLAKELIEDNYDKISSGHHLLLCLKAAPDFAEMLLEKLQDKIHGSGLKSMDFLRTYLSSQTHLAQYFLEKDKYVRSINDLYRKRFYSQSDEARRAVRFFVNDEVFFQRQILETEKAAFEKQKPHFLSVSNVDDLKSLLDFNKDALQEVSVLLVRDINGRIDEFLELVKQHFPSVCHIMVPSESLGEFQQKNQSKYSCEAVDVVPFQEKKQKDPEQSGTRSLYEQIAAGNAEPSANASVEVKQEIFIAAGNLEPLANASSEPHVTYNMAKAGEVLNGSSKGLCVRNSVVKREDITRSLRQEKVVPESFKAVSVRVLDEKTIAELKSKPAQNGVYYRFNSSLHKGKFYRLFSISTNEDLAGLISDPTDAKIKIKRGDDDFLLRHC